jgi:Sulfotransferase family
MATAELDSAEGALEGRPVASDAPFAEHVELRTVVLADRRILFVPNPKAACTSILWLLSELAGIPADRFEHSTLPEVSPALTVHDMGLWGAGYRLADYEGEERERILREEGWLRFALVRHPEPRLWSAWFSKLLLREPGFVERFADEPWFPRLPRDPDEIVADFRSFVAALPGGNAEDVHWAVQHDLLSQVPLDHVGRVDKLDETLEVLRVHVGSERLPESVEHENRTGIPMAPNAYDASSQEIVRARYGEDFAQYGFSPVEPSEDQAEIAAWRELIGPLLPFLRDMVERHERIGRLNQVARRVQSLERRTENRSAFRGEHLSAPVLVNDEGLTDFNIQWAWSEAEPRPGFTAVVRAKNEARTLPWTLPPLLRAADRVVLVDNGSTDGTAEIAVETAAEAGADGRLEVHSYPFPIARCGPEHLSTPAGSVHSLAYFYNWSFAFVRTRYALKWDSDMVLSDSGVRVLLDLAWQLEAADVIVKIPRYPLWIEDERRAYIDLGLWNCEPWAWPNRPGYSFVKAMEWEQPFWPADTPVLALPDWSCVELKHLDTDEFAHWSHTNFEATARTRRKRREWQVFHALTQRAEPPREVVPIVAPADTHVIDYVRSVWLPQKAAERDSFGERLISQLTA